MTPRLAEYELAIVVIFCILGIFLFPAVQGPYSAVHGPVTALQSVRSRIRWCRTMVQAALSLARLPFSLPLSNRFWPAWLGSLEPQPLCPSPGADAKLRC